LITQRSIGCRWSSVHGEPICVEHGNTYCGGVGGVFGNGSCNRERAANDSSACANATLRDWVDIAAGFFSVRRRRARRRSFSWERISGFVGMWYGAFLTAAARVNNSSFLERKPWAVTSQAIISRSGDIRDNLPICAREFFSFSLVPRCPNWIQRTMAEVVNIRIGIAVRASSWHRATGCFLGLIS